MSKEDVINYVMTTPGNTNRAVLGSMLDSIKGDGEIPYPKIFMQVTPGMSFYYNCLTHSYEDFIAFKDGDIVWLDEEWTNGQAEFAFHGLLMVRKVNDIVFLLNFPSYSSDTDSSYNFNEKYYEISTDRILSATCSFTIYK